MKRRAREELERLIGKIILMLIQSIILTIGLCCCIWLIGMIVNLMEHSVLLTIAGVGLVAKMLKDEIM